MQSLEPSVDESGAGTFTRTRPCLLLTALYSCLLLAGCALPFDAAGPERNTELQQSAARLLSTPAATPRWEQLVLPGKRSEPFEPASVMGQPALRVQANSSVSILRQRFAAGLPTVGRITFSWKVDVLPVESDLRDPQAEDSPVRIVLAFGGDRTLLSARAHRLSELSQLLTGDELPYATLAYVWSANEPLETVVHNPRTDRIRKLVVETGGQSLGQWLRYQRDVRKDFFHAFGENPGPLLAVALMTDTDNTSSRLQAWYGGLRLEAAEGAPELLVQSRVSTGIAGPGKPLPH
jgi:hypothetical protein